MRISHLLATSLLLLSFCFNLQAQKVEGSDRLGAVMQFDKKYHDFGSVKKGEIKTTFFEFTNTGDEAIEIELISACDCTTTDYPRLPVKPGEKGVIKVIFDSTEKEESEVIDVDIYLKNSHPKTGVPIIEMVQYTYNLKS